MYIHIRYQERLQKIREALQEKDLAVLVGTRLNTVTHVSGVFCPWRSAVVVPAEGEIQLITLMMDASRVEDETWLESVSGYGPFPGQSFVETIVKHIEDLGLEKGTVGIESGGSAYLPDGFITLAEYEALGKAMPGATLVNANDVIARLTLIKEDEEVKLMRQATAMCDFAHEVVRQELRVGMSEKQVAGIAEQALREAGSEFAWTFTGGQEIASGYRSSYPMGGCTPATDKIIQCGESVVLDLHGMYGLMLGDVAHNAIMGCPTPAQQEVMTAYVETCYCLLEAMQPGRTLGEVAREVGDFVEKNGWQNMILPGYGHGIGHFGMEWYPCVFEAHEENATEPDLELEPNYMQMIAVVCNEPGVAGFRLERPLLITPTGNELLSKLPIEPWIIDENCQCDFGSRRYGERGEKSYNG
jgi:Xaa-Pro dipeptidase